MLPCAGLLLNKLEACLPNIESMGQTRPAIFAVCDGQAPCLQFRRERQQSVTPSIHHLCFCSPVTMSSATQPLSHSITPSLHHSITPSLHHSITPSLHHSITPSLYHQSLCHSSCLHCSLISLFLSSTPSTLTLGSGFDWFP